jgi:hypothetical protein
MTQLAGAAGAADVVRGAAVSAAEVDTGGGVAEVATAGAVVGEPAPQADSVIRTPIAVITRTTRRGELDVWFNWSSDAQWSAVTVCRV